MDQQSIRKTYKYKLKPTPEQKRELEHVLLLCRRLYNTALEQRKTAYERCGVSLSRYGQEAELKAIRADVPIQPLPATGQETGIDLGLEAFATLSDGRRIFHPGWYRKAEHTLKTAQRRVSRRKRGSNRRRKAVELLAKAHLKVKRQRQDFHHKVAIQLVRQYDMIYHEDLQTANLLKHHHLAKSISDAGWSGFLSILSVKAACAGRSVVAVPPAYSSQMCSGCGVLVHKGLSVRWHSCPDCGISLHRDHNAAKNIQSAGQVLRGGVALAASENRESAGLQPVRSVNRPTRYHQNDTDAGSS
jgi:IS605 OrfB family transposase